MTTAISINFVVSVLALAYGSYVSIKHMHALEPKKRTPPTDFWLLSVGMIGWSIFGLMSFTAMIDYPKWLYNDASSSSWGYTTARIFMLVFWVGVLRKCATNCKKYDEFCDLCNQYRVRKK